MMIVMLMTTMINGDFPLNAFEPHIAAAAAAVPYTAVTPTWAEYVCGHL